MKGIEVVSLARYLPGNGTLCHISNFYLGMRQVRSLAKILPRNEDRFQANFTLNVTGNALGNDTQKIEVQDAEMQMWTVVRWARHLQLARDNLKYRLHFLVMALLQ